MKKRFILVMVLFLAMESSVIAIDCVDTSKQDANCVGCKQSPSEKCTDCGSCRSHYS